MLPVRFRGCTICRFRPFPAMHMLACSGCVGVDEEQAIGAAAVVVASASADVAVAAVVTVAANVSAAAAVSAAADVVAAAVVC
ncbi:unnamed protein product [Closterium sp. NIES-53]